MGRGLKLPKGVNPYLTLMRLRVFISFLFSFANSHFTTSNDRFRSQTPTLVSISVVIILVGASTDGIILFLFRPNSGTNDQPEVDPNHDPATAILRRKSSPNKLMVDDATNDDNSVITLSTATMETLQLFRGDTVIVKGKKRRDTVLIVLADDDVEDNKARINKGKDRIREQTQGNSLLPLCYLIQSYVTTCVFDWATLSTFTPVPTSSMANESMSYPSTIL
jgi:hypothetical protein